MHNHSDNLLNMQMPATDSSGIIGPAIKTQDSPKIIKTNARYPALIYEFCQKLDLLSSFKLQNNEGDYFKVTLLKNNIDYIAEIAWDIIEPNFYGDLAQNGAIMIGRRISGSEIKACLEYVSGNCTIDKHELYGGVLLGNRIILDYKKVENEYELMTKCHFKNISLVRDSNGRLEKEIIEVPSFILFAPHHVDKNLEAKIFFELLVNNYIVPEETKLILYEKGGCLVLNQKNHESMEYQIFTHDESETLRKNEQRKLSLIKHPIDGYVFTIDMSREKYIIHIHSGCELLKISEIIFNFITGKDDNYYLTEKIKSKRNLNDKSKNNLCLIPIFSNVNYTVTKTQDNTPSPQNNR